MSGETEEKPDIRAISKADLIHGPWPYLADCIVNATPSELEGALEAAREAHDEFMLGVFAAACLYGAVAHNREADLLDTQVFGLSPRKVNLIQGLTLEKEKQTELADAFEEVYIAGVFDTSQG